MRPGPATIVALLVLACSVVPFVGGGASPARSVDFADGTWRRLDSRANEHVPSNQYEASLHLDETGGYVAWRSRRQQDGRDGVYLRRFDERGGFPGPEHPLHPRTGADQGRPVVVRSDDVVWAACELHRPDGTPRLVLTRSSGRGEAPAAVELDTGTDVRAGIRGGAHGAVSLTAAPDGGVLAAYVARGTREPIARLQGLCRDGRPLGAPVQVGPARAVACASDRDGAALVWQPPEGGLRAGRFDWRGRPSAAPIRVDDIADAVAIEPALAAGPGGFAVAWMSLPAGAAAYRVRVRRLDRDTRPVAASRVADADAPWNSGANLACFQDGRIAVAWNQEETGSNRSLACLRILTADGGAGPILTLGPGRVLIGGGRRSVAVNRDGAIAVAWSGASPGDDHGVNLTLLRPERRAVGSPTAPRATAGPPVEPVFLPHDPPVTSNTSNTTGTAPGPGAGSAGFGAAGDFGFPGFSFGFHKGIPPDTHIAVGPNHVVGVVNFAIAFWTRQGTPTYLAELDGGSGFWAPVGGRGQIFDPEVHWDPHAGRFVAMACERVGTAGSMFLIAISDDADPNGVWHKYRFDVTAWAGTSIDSPNLGIDDQAYYLAADMQGNKRQYALYIVEKQPLLSGGPPGRSNQLTMPRYGAGVPVMWGKGPAMYLIQETADLASVNLFAIRNPLTTPVVALLNVRVPAYTPPGPINQKGTSYRLGVFSNRFWSCVWRNGSLWAVHHQGSPVKARWYEFKLGNWPLGGQPVLAQSGDVQVKPGNHASFNSIAVDESGNALMTFTDSGTNDYPGIARCWRAATDPLGTMRPAVVTRASPGPYLSLRWGDYSAAAADPAEPNTIWYSHEYAPFSTNDWATWIGRKKTAILGADVATISAGTGGTVNFTLDNPSHRGRSYVMILGLSGTTPGFRLGNLQVPINFDAATAAGIDLVLAAHPALQGFLGRLDADGNATATLTLPPLPPLQGLSAHFAFVQDPIAGWSFASPPVRVTFVR